MRLSLVQQAMAELEANRCYCGAAKVAKKSFCGTCYYSLPRETQRALYKSFSDGYAQIYDDAKEWLRLNTDRINFALAHEIKER